MDLFEYMSMQRKKEESPLAVRMRPKNLDEVVGQQHIIGKDKLLYRAIKADKISSLIFYGPPGTGKTTLAKVIANTTSADFVQMNATTSGKKDMEQAVSQAKDAFGMYGKKTILFIDEIHRFNKAQQDYLLPFVEDGTVIFAYDPSEDEVLGENMRQYMGAVISCPTFTRGETYQLWLDGTVTGTETGGVYTSVTAYSGGIQMQYTGTDVGMGGMGGPRPEGGMPEDSDGQRPQPGDFTPPDGDTGRDGQHPEKPDGERLTLPEGETMLDRQPPEGGQNAAGEASTGFYMNDMVNAFSGITAV